MITWTIPRLSTEWIGPIEIHNGGIVVEDWTAAVFRSTYQPTTPTEINDPPTILDGQRGVLIGPGTPWNLTPGLHRLWITFQHPPETPVLDDVTLIHIT